MTPSVAEREQSPDEPRTGPYLAVSTIILAMMLIAIGSGLLGTFVPIRLDAAGIGGRAAGLVVAAYAVGLLGGCLLSGWTVRRVGHIRAYAGFGSLAACSVLLLGADVSVATWVVLRAVMGFCTNAVFIVGQSWLNEVTASAYRGRVMALFYVSFTASFGCGAFLNAGLDPLAATPYMIATGVYVLAVAAVALTRLESPPPPARIRIDLARVWRVSPVGLVGAFAAGMLGTTLQGVGAIYGTLIGLAPAAIALLMGATQIGNLVIQWPLGWLSDRVDRRSVVLIASGLVMAGAAGVLATPGHEIARMLALFALLGGAGESLYAVSIAQANDHAGAGNYVTVSSTLLVAWSSGAIVGPLLASAAMSALGADSLFAYILWIAATFAAFVAWRRRAREPAPPSQREDFVALPAASPVIAELNPNAPDPAPPAG